MIQILLQQEDKAVYVGETFWTYDSYWGSTAKVISFIVSDFVRLSVSNLNHLLCRLI